MATAKSTCHWVASFVGCGCAYRREAFGETRGYVPLPLAYAFSIVGSGLVPLVAWLVFKEPLDWRFPVGYLLMLTGFAVIMTGQRAVAG